MQTQAEEKEKLDQEFEDEMHVRVQKDLEHEGPGDGQASAAEVASGSGVGGGSRSRGTTPPKQDHKQLLAAQVAVESMINNPMHDGAHIGTTPHEHETISISPTGTGAAFPPFASSEMECPCAHELQKFKKIEMSARRKVCNFVFPTNYPILFSIQC